MRARELVEDGSTIFVDASSTGLALARVLELRPPTELTLVTNSPAIALGPDGGHDPRDRAAGELNQHMRVLTGRWTVDFLDELNIAIGVHLGRRHHARARADDVAQRARGHAQRGRGRGGDEGRAARLDEVQAVVAADRAQAQSLDLIITDDGLDPATVAEYRRAGVNLVVADRSPSSRGRRDERRDAKPRRRAGSAASASARAGAGRAAAAGR